MQILKGKKERQGEYNRYVPLKEQKEISLDRKVEQAKANKLAARSHNFKEWKDSDGSIFTSYSQLIDYQVDKFAKRYPPNFATSIRPELVRIVDNHMSWNREAVNILMRESDQWYNFKRNLEMSILKWGGYEGVISDPEADSELNRILNEFAITIINLINENNT